MKAVVLKRVDEMFPVDVEEAVRAVVLFLINHDPYIHPFCKTITNMPSNFLGNAKFMIEVEKYFTKSFKLNQYYIGDVYADKDVRYLVGLLTSYFAFYDDTILLDFIQRNSRYSIRKKENPEELQIKAFARLKGYVFEQLVFEMFKRCYKQSHCKLENGCIVEIDGKIIQIRYGEIPRKTIDIAGLDEGNASCDMIECKVQPIRIDEVVVKYVTHLYEKMRWAGYKSVRAGFVTAGTRESVQLMIAQRFETLRQDDPGLVIYDMEDLRMLTLSA